MDLPTTPLRRGTCSRLKEPTRAAAAALLSNPASQEIARHGNSRLSEAQVVNDANHGSGGGLVIGGAGDENGQLLQ